ncbi:potassium-transporting ATPase subunit F [Leptolyngbya sp. NIES-2104]|uniref:potassium-transporting ATPase subunit F n=1 Tax=Leptolyngbya sp. NIES-2104 TaxID=1552121 RepID=UPI0006EC4E8F|nr:potassium-transporting ATPase subunit F [Leptolyngbya sp. NIES-2104]GAP98275.1 potassium-dependent ATPase G chain [Leptolyngbya sp. NIES-2104]
MKLTTDDLAELWSAWRRKKAPTYLFLAICFNLVLAPLVYAASDNAMTKTQSWSLGLLGLGVVALSGYLFVVMFAPERF